MASISLRSGKYRAYIRRKNKQMSASFSDKTTAEIWSRYHEELIDNMENFQLKPENYITFEQCLELKLQDLKEKEANKKTIQDFENVLIHFKEIRNIPFGEITSDILREIGNKMNSTIVKRGGSVGNDSSGDYRKISTGTILNRFRYLSSVFGFMIEKGANIINPAQAVINQIKMSAIKKGESIEDDN